MSDLELETRLSVAGKVNNVGHTYHQSEKAGGTVVCKFFTEIQVYVNTDSW